MCSKNTYYDDVVERCTPCAQICEFARIQGTEGDCKRNCPDYGVPHPGDSGSVTDYIIGGVVPGLLILVIVVGFIMWLRRRRTRPVRLPIQETMPPDSDPPQTVLSDLHIPMIDHHET